MTATRMSLFAPTTWPHERADNAAAPAMTAEFLRNVRRVNEFIGVFWSEFGFAAAALRGPAIIIRRTSRKKGAVGKNSRPSLTETRPSPHTHRRASPRAVQFHQHGLQCRSGAA